MQKRKFDELISHFNRKVSDMSIDQKYKMELLGMISAIGFAHEKELGTNLASLGTDCISRQAAIDAVRMVIGDNRSISVCDAIKQLPPIQPVIVRCKDCKHRDPEDKKCDCGHDILWQLPRRNDWFCADGERRENNESN